MRAQDVSDLKTVLRGYGAGGFRVACGMSALLLAACGGGGGNGVDYDPDAATQALVNKVEVSGVPAALVGGAPPEATPETQVVLKAPGNAFVANVGSKVTVPLEVTSSVDLNALFAKVEGAQSYFSADLAGTTKAIRTKVDTTLDFQVEIPTDLEPGGKLCFEFSARGVNGDVSNVDSTCLSVRDAVQPTPAPSSCSAAGADVASWRGSGTDTDGQPISIDFTAVDDGSGPFNYFFTTTDDDTGALLTKLGYSMNSENSALGFIYIPGAITGVRQYTAGADDTATCATGNPSQGRFYLWDQLSAVVNVSRFEDCGNGDAYVELTFSCDGQYISNPNSAGSVEGEYRGIYSNNTGSTKATYGDAVLRTTAKELRRRSAEPRD